MSSVGSSFDIKDGHNFRLLVHSKSIFALFQSYGKRLLASSCLSVLCMYGNRPFVCPRWTTRPSPDKFTLNFISGHFWALPYVYMCCVIAAVHPTLLQLKAAFLKSPELREGSVVPLWGFVRVVMMRWPSEMCRMWKSCVYPWESGGGVGEDAAGWVLHGCLPLNR